MTRFCTVPVLALLVGGCEVPNDPQPDLETYGVMQTVCLFLCFGTVEVVADDALNNSGTTTQSPTAGAISNSVSGQASVGDVVE